MTRCRRQGNLNFPLFALVLALACTMLPGVNAGLAQAANTPKVIEVKLIAAPSGQVYFDPVGIHIEPGDTVRWVQISGFHSITAYHPANDHHELRIPENASSWDSGILMAQSPAPGSVFEHQFTVEGVYDYYCRPHEQAGMAGRIIVGRPLDGPGTRSFNYSPEKRWKPVPQAAQNTFPSIQEIMIKGIVPFPAK